MSGWFGIDLDGTLARHGYGDGIDSVGAPIPEMVKKVQDLIARGHTVKIMSARFSHDDAETERQEKMVKAWCFRHLGQELECTCKKDFDMIELWDDRAKQVLPNTGMFVEELMLRQYLRNNPGGKGEGATHDGRDPSHRQPLA